MPKFRNQTLKTFPICSLLLKFSSAVIEKSCDLIFTFFGSISIAVIIAIIFPSSTVGFAPLKFTILPLITINVFEYL
jgi:hypothetical protein